MASRTWLFRCQRPSGVWCFVGNYTWCLCHNPLILLPVTALGSPIFRSSRHERRMKLPFRILLVQAFGEVTQAINQWGSSSSPWTAARKFLQNFLLPPSSVLTTMLRSPFCRSIHVHSHYYVSFSALDCGSLSSSLTVTPVTLLERVPGAEQPSMPQALIRYPFSIQKSQQCLFLLGI